MALTISKQPTANSLQLANSPILIQAVSTNVSDDDFKYQCKVYIWHGERVADKPSTPSYTLEKQPNASISQNVIFNISGLIRSELDEIEPSSMTSTIEDVSTGACWAYVQILGIGDSTETENGNEFYVTRGYSPSSREEINGSAGFVSGGRIMTRPSNTEVYLDHAFYVPVIRQGSPSVTIIDEQGNDHTETLTANSSNSATRIQYVDIIALFKDELGGNGSTLTYRTTTDASDNVVLSLATECKFDVIPVMYLNRFGVFETLFMSKKKTRSMTYSRVNYKRSAFIDSYDVNLSRKMVVGEAEVETKYTLNSTFLDEAENSMYEDLLLSTYVCIYVDSKWRQVAVDNTSFQEKTHLNDRLIRHSITFTQGFSDVNMFQ